MKKLFSVLALVMAAGSTLSVPAHAVGVGPFGFWGNGDIVFGSPVGFGIYGPGLGLGFGLGLGCGMGGIGGLGGFGGFGGFGW